MKIADFSVDHPVPVAVFYIIIFVLGLLALSRISLDLLPDIDYPVVAVMARYRHASIVSADCGTVYVRWPALAFVGGAV